MIILPDRNVSHTKFLLPIHKKYWRTPSQTQKKDQLGNEDNTKFRIQAKTNDGVVIWTGWFDDREDFDAFLWAIASGSIKQEKALWNLPIPNWQPYLGEILSYEFATVTFLTSSPGSSTTYTVPTDWNNNNNTIEGLGGGGRGGTRAGGGGGAYAKTTNVVLTRGSSVSRQVGLGSTGTTGSGTTPTNNTWFVDGSTLVAAGGVSGVDAGNNLTALSGGTVANSVGSTKYAGGNSGTPDSSAFGSGGGGAAGKNGAGANGANAPGGGGSAGGTADNGFGGAGGSVGNVGGNGTEWSASYGSGGGGGGPSSLGGSGRSGGNYGGGGGGFLQSAGGAAGAGIQGLLVITYEPFTSRWGMLNSPMNGI